MKLQKSIALALVAALSGCATARETAGGSSIAVPSAQRSPSPATSSGRPSNLQLAALNRAAKYPWRDGGQCAVDASAGGWELVVRRCYGKLDFTRLQFTNPA